MVDRYARSSHSLKHARRSKSRNPSPARSAALPEPDWESLRKAIFGDGGPLTVNNEGMRFILDQGQRTRFEKLNGAIQQINATDPGSPPRAMVVNDTPKPFRPARLHRGATRDGRAGGIPRRFLNVLSGSDRPPSRKAAAGSSWPRRSRRHGNPLTARVFVNRVWLWHFGKGLVATPSDFGLRSDPPSHPELLDYLADEFIKPGWSIKALHRRIMLSSTYQQQSDPRPDRAGARPRKPPAVAVQPAAARLRVDARLGPGRLRLAGAGFRRAGVAIESPSPSCPGARSMASSTARTSTDVYRTFDFAVPDATSPRRFVTTVPSRPSS